MKVSDLGPRQKPAIPRDAVTSSIRQSHDVNLDVNLFEALFEKSMAEHWRT